MTEDNIETNTAALEEKTPEPTPAPQQPQDPGFMNMPEVYKMITQHYSREFNNLRIMFTGQMLDGSPIDFVDSDLQTSVASGRLRFRNMLTVDEKSKELKMVVMISDITFSRPQAPMGAFLPKKE